MTNYRIRPHVTTSEVQETALDRIGDAGDHIGSAGCITEHVNETHVSSVTYVQIISGTLLPVHKLYKIKFCIQNV